MAKLFVADTAFAGNGPVMLVSVGTGLRSDGVNSQIRLSGAVVTGSQQGLLPINGGAILSYSDNRISGNDVDGAPTGFVTDASFWILETFPALGRIG